MNASTVIGLTLVLLTLPTVRADEAVTVSGAKKDGNGFLVHEVRSPYQATPTQIRVLLPDNMEKGKKSPAQ